MAQSLEKQVHEMVKLAKEVRNEAEFQQKHQYKKFKANFNGGVQKDIKHLVNLSLCGHHCSNLRHS